MPFFDNLVTSQKVIFCSYIILIALTIIGLIVFGILLAKIVSGKFVKSCKSISDFSNESGIIDDNNLEQFEATCLPEGSDEKLLEGWKAFKEVRFGYPSECFDKEGILSRFSTKKFKIGVCAYTAVIFVIGVIISIYALVVNAKTDEFALVTAITSIIIPLIILPSYMFVKPNKKAEAAFDQAMEDLDTAVKLQKCVERAVDNGRLAEISEAIKDVIISEQSKPIPSKKEQMLRNSKEESLDDIKDELFADDDVEPAVVEAPYMMSEPVEYDAAEDTAVEEATVEEATVEEEPQEVIAEEVSELPEEEPAPVKKTVKFEPFVGVLNQAIDGDYDTATLKKLANILVLAFTKFTEPAQREELKGSIRRFIVSYKVAAAKEAAAAAAASEEEEYADDGNVAEYSEEAIAEEEAEESLDDEDIRAEILAEEEDEFPGETAAIIEEEEE